MEKKKKTKRLREESGGESSSGAVGVDAVEAAYAEIDGYDIARAEKRRQRDAGVFQTGIQYGEIATRAFVTALEWCRPSAGDTFIDLGSGTGKAVLTAAAHTAFSSATGVELLKPLHDAAMKTSSIMLDDKNSNYY